MMGEQKPVSIYLHLLILFIQLGKIELSCHEEKGSDELGIHKHMDMHIHIDSGTHKSVSIYERIQRAENYSTCFNALNLRIQSFQTVENEVETLLKGVVCYRKKIKHQYSNLSASIFLFPVLFI